MKIINLVSITLALFLSMNVGATPLDKLLSEYAASANVKADLTAADKLWKKSFVHKKSGQKRSCTSCHGENLTLMGEHAKTHKAIDPLAPSVTPDRLTNIKKIQKWLRRNCKWTMGRKCSSQEKINLLSYIKSK